jgi:hypothetical protein
MRKFHDQGNDVLKVASHLEYRQTLLLQYQCKRWIDRVSASTYIMAPFNIDFLFLRFTSTYTTLSTHVAPSTLIVDFGHNPFTNMYLTNNL